MQLLFDFLPVIAFFVAYQLAGIYVATAVIIAATAIQVSVHWGWKRRVNPLHLLSAGLVLVFGGLTLWLRDAAFIMWKPTIVCWLLAVAFLVSPWRAFGGRPLVERLMSGAESELALDATQWLRLNTMWVVFQLFLGTANVVAFQVLDEAAWVKFKLFGLMGLTLAFVFAQGYWIAVQLRRNDAAAG